MTVCSNPNCLNPAVRLIKPDLCNWHHTERARRQAATRAQANCSECGQKSMFGITTCRSCTDASADTKAFSRTVQDTLDACETLDDIKDFIRDHLIKDS
jgi:hypothetical protein